VSELLVDLRVGVVQKKCLSTTAAVYGNPEPESRNELRRSGAAHLAEADGFASIENCKSDTLAACRTCESRKCQDAETRSVEDAALMMNLIAQPDASDW
jgi:hypothetical protein